MSTCKARRKLVECIKEVLDHSNPALTLQMHHLSGPHHLSGYRQCKCSILEVVYKQFIMVTQYLLKKQWNKNVSDTWH